MECPPPEPPAPPAAHLTHDNIVHQAAMQAAMLAVPLIDSDSDEDDTTPARAAATTATADAPAPAPAPNPTNATATTNAQAPSNPIRPKSEPVCVSMPVQPPECATPAATGKVNTPPPSTAAADAAATSTDAPTTAKAVTAEMDDAPSDSAMADDDPAASIDTINVSRSCLDGVLEQLASRISELEEIRERKKARVERLSSAALLPQAAVTGWGMAPGGALPGGAPPVVAPVNTLLGAAAAARSVPPPPPPPPADGERKQSRYWTADEHERFLAAIKSCGPKNYVRIAELVGTRNAKQVRTHAQKFQKKLEREEAKRRDDMRRHGGAAGTVSAAAVAAVAAAAAAMRADGTQYPHLVPYMPVFAAAGHPHAAQQPIHPAAAAAAAAMHHGQPQALVNAGAVRTAAPQADGSSSTNGPAPLAVGAAPADVGQEHVEPEAVAAAVAAEAAALGSRVYAAPANAGGAAWTSDKAESSASGSGGGG